MIISGLGFENEQKIVQAKFDLYSRSDGEAEYRINMYNKHIESIMPYVKFDFSETKEVTEEDQRKDFVDTFKSIDWYKITNGLPIKE